MPALAARRPTDTWARSSHRPVVHRVEDVGLDQLTARADAWDALAARAASPNPFYTRPVLQAHAEAGLVGGTRVLTVSRGDRLAAVLPYQRAAWFGFGRRARAAWRSPYTPSSIPLIDADDPDGAVAALLDGMAERPGPWLFPAFTLDDAVGLAVRAEIDRRGWPHAVLDTFERPVLQARAGHARYLSDLGASRRKELARRARRLETLGEVRLRTSTGEGGLEAGLDAFLALEAAGWKGRSGSALASRPATETLARRLFGEARPLASPRIDILELDGRLVAASLALVCGGTGYMMKSAYDEGLARSSPGMVLEDAIVQAMHETGFAGRLNSMAGPGSHMEGIYPEREAVGDLVIAAGRPGSRRAFELQVKAETRRRAGLRRAKALYRRLRAMREP